jgi:hypothetical protein
VTVILSVLLCRYVKLRCPSVVMLNSFQYLGVVKQVQILKRVQDDGGSGWLMVVLSV